MLNSKKKIGIVGAGITGLALGYFLKQKFQDSIDLTIYEKSRRAGGWISTIEQEGFLFEQGPRSCRTKGNGLYTLQLIEELGLKEEVITPSSDAMQRYLFFDQKLQALPKNFFESLKAPYRQWLISAIYHDLKAKPPVKEESIQDYARRHFGEKVSSHLFDALVSGIYAGDATQLSFKSCFPELEKLSSKGSLILGWLQTRKTSPPHSLSSFQVFMQKHPFFSFNKGMQTLTNRLAYLLHPHICYETLISELPGQNDHIILTQPTTEMSTLFAKDLEVSAKLKEIPYTSLAVVNLGYRRDVLDKKGFGYLIPSKEYQDILGVVFDSKVFPQQDRFSQTRLTVMIGGERFGNFQQHTELSFKAIAKKSIREHLNIQEEPDFIQCKIAVQAIPQYKVGHDSLIKAVKAKFQNTSIHFLSTAFHGVAVNDCIANAKKFTEAFVLTSRK